jgi:hypothetical protein
MLLALQASETYMHRCCCLVCVDPPAGGTNLQLPPWAVLKETLASYNWTQFTQLGLPRMGLMGPVGPLQSFPQLTMLDLSHNQLTGAVPADLQAFTGLRYLNLANNSLYGKGGTTLHPLQCFDLRAGCLSDCCICCVLHGSKQHTETPPCRHFPLQAPCRPT